MQFGHSGIVVYILLIFLKIVFWSLWKHTAQFIYQFQYFWGCPIQIGLYFPCSNYLGAKTGPKRGMEFEVSAIEIIHISISIFLGMPNLNLPLFFISDPSGG